MSSLRSLRARFSALSSLPLRAPLAPGGAKKSSKDKGERLGFDLRPAEMAADKKVHPATGPRKVGELSKEVVTGCALLKGEQDPAIKPDDQYPSWLFELLKQPPTIKELEKDYDGVGLTMPQLQRLWRLKNKERIKGNNADRS